ncbi:PP2C family protein-serine/threonine phosphatase [Ningiella sp. W23]|uniref:PP2C family protein-serine/threonine phosphatase n=1 Tax=Ningiella sp. W23 TaxID=3023715 RepID=UPI003756AFF9
MAILTTNPMIDKQYGWRFAHATDTGKVRRVNEDCFFSNPEQAHWAVADGMGGHQAGDVASQMIVKNLSAIVQSESFSKFVDEVDDTLLGVNENLSALALSRNTVIGSTVVGAALHQQHILFYWVGDSRGYLFRDKRLVQITKDHTLVQELVDNGEITREQAEQHPDKNVITRAVGSHPELFADYTMIPFQSGDKFLICSDGIEKEINDAELSLLLAKHNDIEECTQAILDKVLSRGARDNVSFVLIELVALYDSTQQ